MKKMWKVLMIGAVVLLLAFIIVQTGIMNQFVEGTVIGFIDTLLVGHVNYEFQMTEPGIVVLSLNWDDAVGSVPKSRLNMMVFDPQNTLIVKDASPMRPKTLIVQANMAGTYRVRVNSYRGASNFKLDVMKPGDVTIANDCFFGKDSLWKFDTRDLGFRGKVV